MVVTCWEAGEEDGNGNGHVFGTYRRAAAVAGTGTGSGTGTGTEGPSADRLWTSPPMRVQLMMDGLLENVTGGSKSRTPAPQRAHEESCLVTRGLTNERRAGDSGSPQPSGDQTLPVGRCSCRAERTPRVAGRKGDCEYPNSPRAHAG